MADSVLTRGAGGPVARGPVAPAPPVVVQDGWEVSARASTAALTLTDVTPLAKVAVRAAHGDEALLAGLLGCGHLRARRRDDGVLVVGSGPGEWLLVGPVGAARRLVSELSAQAPAGTGLVDLTHGRAMMRLTGADAARLLAKVCAIDLRERATPDGTAFRTSVAAVVTDVVRDDVPAAGAPVRSYLLHSERSVGQFMFDALLDAGAELGIEVAGLAAAPA